MEYEELIDACLRLKEVKRKGWVESGVDEVESVAAHSFSVALMSAVLAMARGLDYGRAALIGLIHDLPEALIGDLTPRDKARMTEGELSRMEDSTLMRLVSNLSEGTKRLVLDLYHEYRSASSEEARLVADMDKFDMAVQAIRYSSITEEFEHRPFVEAAMGGIRDARILKLLKEYMAKKSREDLK